MKRRIGYGHGARGEGWCNEQIVISGGVFIRIPYSLLPRFLRIWVDDIMHDSRYLSIRLNPVASI